MIDVGLFDGSFSTRTHSATLAGDNVDERPKHIRWVKDRYMPVTFFTDMCIDKVVDAPPHITKVAWLIEPPSISKTHYYKAAILQDDFDYILTFDRGYLSYDRWLFYPLGGSWIHPNKYDGHVKARRISMIASDKTIAEGHMLRHAVGGIADQHDIHLWGSGYYPIDTKDEGLSKYQFSIVIESCRMNDYFSEKLIDCLCQETIPIYWGCPSIGSFFDMDGIITFESMGQLITILNAATSTGDYIARRKAIVKNKETALQYRVAEDWIFENYPYIFEE